ncbi:glycosyltransferase family 9 protein [Mitsuaria sp. WAJ17]|uniref:glycosyltransferase family 9 protein n=1 Tax=Mitsuaria sp. WAJ17 TaxID=2761452 RepID=UPI0016003916|nr:glycosyltransferase family 9 protein [Mitsuaria sp. WAJ17]MBB2485337.1 glycosyltransferase family 9 protein [Mitsuaria sp. WAJ17]
MSATAIPPAWAQVRRVLLLRLDGMGDVLMSTPAMAAVRECLPQATLSLLSSPAGAALAPHLPWLDQVLSYEAPWVRPGEASQGGPAGEGGADEALLLQLRRERFDAAIIFSTCTQSALPAALMCRLARIPLRLAHARESCYGLLSHRLPEPDALGPAMRHEVQRQLDLVASVGLHTVNPGLRFALRAADVQRVAALLAEAGLPPGRPYLLLHPGASAPSRRYPPEAFAAAVAVLSGEGGPALAVCAGPGEAGLLQRLGAALPRPPLQLPGPPSLGELGALIGGACLLIANNSGPVHLAAALGTPVVTLYALTNPQHTPWRVPSRVLSHEVPCRDCLKSVCPQGHQRCLTGVPPEAVTRAAWELLAEAAS